MNPPTVSIVVPTYNREALLPRALDSIVAQTLHDWEIVLVDDGSTDGTEQVAAHYLDRLGDRFVYIQQDNRGSSSARNRGIDSCRGRFVAFLDSDDEFLPHKLERQLALFKACPEAGFVYSDYAYVDSDGVYHPSAFDTNFRLGRQVPYEAVGPALCLCSREVFDVLLRGYFIATIVGMVRRQVLGETIRFGVDQAYAEEWLFYLEVARNCRVGFVDEPLSVHHFVEGSLARTDKRRNALRYCNLLLAIENAFDDLTLGQRKVIRHNLQQARRQLGYDAQRVGRHREAFGYFAESLRCSPAPGTLSETVRAAGRWLLVGAAPPGVRKQPREERPLDARQGDIGRRPDRSTHVRQSTGRTRASAGVSTIEPVSFPGITNPSVWDRLWRHRPADAKDDALLAREEHSPRCAMIVDRLEAAFGSIEGLSTVELGSGRGDLSALLARRGARVTLLDASEKALAQAARRFERLGLKARYEHADMLGTLAPWQERFDAALSSGVIEHFKGNDRTRAVQAHFDTLRPGGVAVISVPNAWCAPYRIWKSYLELRGWWPYGVEIPYTRREMTRCAREVGFARVETCSIGFWQSVGDHWGRSLLGLGPDWVDKPSRFDGVMGATLLTFGWRAEVKDTLPREEG